MELKHEKNNEKQRLIINNQGLVAILNEMIKLFIYLTHSFITLVCPIIY